MNRRVEITSPAKINLGLEILGRRPDGYHEIRTVMAMIELADQLSVFEDPLESNGVVAGVAGHENLVRRALDAFRSRVPQSASLGWAIEKRIPAAAGLGGASSNAAAALLAANVLAGEPLGPDDLHTLASGLGSDIPFFLEGPVGLASGRGTEIERLPGLSGSLLILVPTIQADSKTASMYGKLVTEDFSDGGRTVEAAGRLAAGQPLDRKHLRNAFARAATTLWPEVAEIHRLLDRMGVQRFALSGAGPSTYVLVNDLGQAAVIKDALRANHSETIRSYVTEFRSTPLDVGVQDGIGG